MAVFLAAIAIPVAASPCWACSCASSGDPAKDRRAQAEGADLVFTGVAKTERVQDPSPGDGLSGDERIYNRFRVRKVHKGHPGRWVTIYTGVNGDSCRYDFEVGTRYTVFASDQRGDFVTNICSGTKRGRINPARYGLD